MAARPLARLPRTDRTHRRCGPPAKTRQSTGPRALCRHSWLCASPRLSDQVQLAIHGSAHATKPVRDLVVRVSLQLPESNLPQALIGQAAQPGLKLLGQHRHKFGGRLTADELLEAPGTVGVKTSQSCLRDHPPAASLELALAPNLIADLAHRDHDQEPPEIVAILEAVEPARRGAGAKTVEGAQGGVFLVLDRRGPRDRFELLSRQTHQAGEIALPKPAGGIGLAILQVPDPPSDRSFCLGAHVQPPVTPARKPHPRREVLLEHYRKTAADRTHLVAEK